MKENAVLLDLSGETLTRVGPDTEGVKGIYFSEFVEERNPNQIRPAAGFRNTADSLITDKEIPLSKISRFYGIEDGKLKIGGLDNFRDSTVVIPVRNRNYGAVADIDIEHSSFWQRLRISTPGRVRELRNKFDTDKAAALRRRDEALVKGRRLEGGVSLDMVGPFSRAYGIRYADRFRQGMFPAAQRAIEAYALARFEGHMDTLLHGSVDGRRELFRMLADEARKEGKGERERLFRDAERFVSTATPNEGLAVGMIFKLVGKTVDARTGISADDEDGHLWALLNKAERQNLLEAVKVAELVVDCEGKMPEEELDRLREMIDRRMAVSEEARKLGSDISEGDMWERRTFRRPSLVGLEPDKSRLVMRGVDGSVLHDETVVKNAGSKLVLGDSLGHAFFINNLNGVGREEVERMNRVLKKHPLFPLLVDNGRYSHYQLEAGSYRDYIRQDLYRPDRNLYVVGSVERPGLSQPKAEEKEGKSEKEALRRQRSRAMYRKLCQSPSRKVGVALKK